MKNRKLAECVCCGDETLGRYEGIPVCAECYRNGNLRYWLQTPAARLARLYDITELAESTKESA